MLEKTYRNMNRQINADPELAARTARLAGGQPDAAAETAMGKIAETAAETAADGAGERVPLSPADSESETDKHNRAATRRPRQRRRRFVPAAAILILCAVLASPVLSMAAGVPAVYELMYQVSPELAQHFVPIQVSCEDNGIRMEVVSAYIHDSEAEIYITMQDLTGDRIDGTTDLFDSYQIRRSFDASASCTLTGYDEDSRTATFLIHISQWGDQEIEGSTLTFSVREFISHKTELEDIPVDVDLSAAPDNPDTQLVSYSGYSTSDDWAPDDPAAVLTPGESLASPMDGMDISAMGYIDGMLHIQLASLNAHLFDGHGFVRLAGQDGSSINTRRSIHFSEDLPDGSSISYQEFLFDVPSDELANYSLYGTFQNSGLNTKGNWQVTFPLTAR